MKRRLFVGVLAALCVFAATVVLASDAQRIQPWKEDPRYWQYKGEPVLLIGASNADNLFNHPDMPPDGLEAHLDWMASVGGNYVRNVMSSRDEGNAYRFVRDEATGLYDLDQANEEYWNRFRDFLDMTYERDIIVQIEIWDRFDYAREPWEKSPFNPKNNINYTAEESGLPEAVPNHPGQHENPFMRTSPEQEHNPLVLGYQMDVVDRMLSISLEYPNVLYCISNETGESELWGAFWAQFIRDRAVTAGVGVEITEMWDAWNLRSDMHRYTFDHPERYSFVDVSQNSHQIGQTQWDNLQWARDYVADPPRPVNSVKTYGGNHGGGPIEGQHKLWRNILGGAASSRYHRPGGGIGLNEVTAAHLASASMIMEYVDLIQAEPNLALLSNRDDDEAYMAATPGRQYALYFPNGGSVELDLSDAQGDFNLRWVDVLKAEWAEQSTIAGGGLVELTPPGDGPSAASITRE